MTIEIKVPQLPESVADATLVAWHRKAGDSVSRDENLADLETDKVVLEVPAPTNGVLKEIRIQGGTTVTSGQVLAVIEEGAAVAKAAPAPVKAQAAAPDTAAGDSAKLSPSVRRLVEENRLDPAQIPASGRDGRITKGDVVSFLDAKVAAPAPAAPATATATATPAARAGRVDQRVPMTRLRQRIA
ncbi:MAG: E3 binding domain-containing protein, partial [Acidobacteria bacterium]|nr:E3 binding domain-containing protein [Acidobacteriota bacterium]